MYVRSLPGNREISCLTSQGGSASGRRGAVADDERAGEVRPLRSSWEAGEQVRATGGGVGGAKGEGRGEHGRATHAPDTEPGGRVPGARPRTRYPCTLLRQTPQVGARGVNCTRKDLCGGCPVMGITT